MAQPGKYIKTHDNVPADLPLENIPKEIPVETPVETPQKVEK